MLESQADASVAALNLAHARLARREYAEALTMALFAAAAAAPIAGARTTPAVLLGDAAFPPLLNYLAYGLAFRAAVEAAILRLAPTPDALQRMIFVLYSGRLTLAMLCETLNAADWRRL